MCGIWIKGAGGELNGYVLGLSVEVGKIDGGVWSDNRLRNERSKGVDSRKSDNNTNRGNEATKGKSMRLGLGHRLMVLVEDVFFYGCGS